ncbi:MAG: hypothetical protein LCH44_07640 [Bacteroidetes bacterium]|nr:hypothetical protein [Bacteroidota bacterium]
MTSLFYPSISPEEGEPNNEVIPSKEFKYQLKSQILSGIKNEREICYTHLFILLNSVSDISLYLCTLKLKSDNNGMEFL